MHLYVCRLYVLADLFDKLKRVVYDLYHRHNDDENKYVEKEEEKKFEEKILVLCQK